MMLNCWRLIRHPLVRIRTSSKHHLGVLQSYQIQQYQTENSKKIAGTIQADEDNEPLKYFGSEAAKWPARYTLRGVDDDMPAYQPAVVIISMIAFLTYFCILREESDIDHKLGKSLFEQVDGLEELQLAISYKYNKERGLDTKDIEYRLKQLGTNIDEVNRKIATSS